MAELKTKTIPDIDFPFDNVLYADDKIKHFNSRENLLAGMKDTSTPEKICSLG
jgi:hypothetical protein